MPLKEKRNKNLMTYDRACIFSHNLVIHKDEKGEPGIVNKISAMAIALVRPYFEFTKFSGQKLVKTNTISVSQKTGG
jgi:hypothetical protein